MDMAILWWILFRLVVSLIFATPMLVALRLKSNRHEAEQECVEPQDAPFALPILGHVVPFSRDMAGYTGKLKSRFGGVPFRLRLLVLDIFYFSNPVHVSKVFRSSSNLTNGPYRKFVSSSFGVPKYFQTFFAEDTSGISHTPHAGSNVKPEHRIDYLMHSFIVQYMTGKGLASMTDRFAINMTKQLELFSKSSPSTPRHDLYAFVQNHIFNASISALFGKAIFDLNPNFCSNFWKFEDGLPDLAKGYPRLFLRSQYKARDQCLAQVHKWHRFLETRRHNDRISSQSEDYDDILGSRIVQQRHDAFDKIGVMKGDARASEDLALIWGSVSNATHATFWLIYAILTDKETQSKFRNEIKDAESSTDKGAHMKKYDVTILCKNDFLQSLYAETLRMHAANIVLRSPSQRPMKIGKWTVKPGKIIATMSYPMHHDDTRYSTGSPPGSRPLHSFWAERFLIPDSEAGAQPTGTKFSTSGLEGSWIPFGGGAYTCPGRYFAKQEMLLTAALLLGNFDIELLGESPKPDWRFFGTGVLGVNGKQIVSMQRKA